MDTQFHGYTKNHSFAHFNRASFMLHVSYISIRLIVSFFFFLMREIALTGGAQLSVSPTSERLAV